MQLHPDQRSLAVHHAISSLAAGFIGLDFGTDPGDLRLSQRTALPAGQTDFWDFAHVMTVGDKVLVFVHHHPFALVTVEGDYNYIKEPVPEIGVWFRHFRRVRDISYYFDRVTNPQDWERIVMTDTISILKDPNSLSYRLIQSW